MCGTVEKDSLTDPKATECRCSLYRASGLNAIGYSMLTFTECNRSDKFNHSASNMQFMPPQYFSFGDYLHKLNATHNHFVGTPCCVQQTTQSRLSKNVSILAVPTDSDFRHPLYRNPKERHE